MFASLGKWMFTCTEIGCFLAKKLDVCFTRKMDVYLHRNLMLVCKKVGCLLAQKLDVFWKQKYDVCLQEKLDICLLRNWVFTCTEI